MPRPREVLSCGSIVCAPKQRQVSGKGDGLPRRDGGARQVRPAVPALRRAHPAHPLRGQRDQLLPDVPDQGRLLADRALSRLLREDWPRTPEELENFVAGRRV